MINSTEKFIFFPFIKTIKHYNLTKLKVVIIFQLDQYGVKLVGNIPRTFPPLSFFPFDFETVGAVFLPAMAIAIFAMVETLSKN